MQAAALPIEAKSGVLDAAKVLVADDSRLQRSLLQHTLEEIGLEVVCAEDGVEALALFQKNELDLVILDIHMPNMDGIEAAERIRNSNADIYVPIIFITGSNNDENLKRCLEVGGDDFISKPFSPVSLSAKIISLLKFKRLYQEQFEQRRKLLQYQQMVAQEEEIASTIYKNILHAGFLDTAAVRYLLSPMALFNGDIFLTSKTPGNQIYLFLGDFTGHGLSASIGAGPTAEIFYGMTRKGFGVSEIISEINRKMHQMLPVNMFLAATIATLSPEANVLKMISCGLPDHYLLNKQSGKIQTISSNNLPLGITSDFNAEVQYFEVDAQDYFYFFTDGIIESENKLGVQFDSTGVIDSLSSNNESGFDDILEAFNKHCNGLDQQQDDITLVEFHCDADVFTNIQHPDSVQKTNVIPLSWKSSMEFHLTTLLHVNPVPVLVNSLMEIQGLQIHREAIFLIVNELFKNAMEHGILKLDKAQKKSIKGYYDYQDQKNSYSSENQDGFIKVGFNHQPISTGGRLIIRVQDSGDGFNFDQILTSLESDVKTISRGLGLVKNLCRSIQYSNVGNRVKAVFEWEV